MSRDWPKLISDLESAGLSLYKIGSCIDLHITQIQRVKAGMEPKYSAGELLIALHGALVTKRTISTTQTEKTGVCSDAADAGTGECSFLKPT